MIRNINIFNVDGLFIQNAVYVEFSRHAYGNPQTNEYLIIDRYSEKDVATTDKNNYPAFELL